MLGSISCSTGCLPYSASSLPVPSYKVFERGVVVILFTKLREDGLWQGILLSGFSIDACHLGVGEAYNAV